MVCAREREEEGAVPSAFTLPIRLVKENKKKLVKRVKSEMLLF